MSEVDNVLPFPKVRQRELDEVALREPTLKDVFGDVLRDERRDQQRSLADVAGDAAVSVPYLSEVERGRKDASSDVLRSICDALELPLPDLLDESARRLRQLGVQGRSGFQLLAA